jgi:deoxyribodipyrimidine photo-lyase
VDAHNIVPCWEASPKQEYAARTIRNKIHNHMPEFFTEFPPVIPHPFVAKATVEKVDWEKAEASLEIDRCVQEVQWATPGTKAGLHTLETFLLERLPHFEAHRNNPNKNTLSNMSPWFHFGMHSICLNPFLHA